MKARSRRYRTWKFLEKNNRPKAHIHIGMKLVMVDDSLADRRLYQLLLEDGLGRRLEFWGEGTGSAGLKRCREVAPDCVLLDYQLPDMSGLDFLAQIRAGDPTDAPRFAVVILTGLADEQIAVSSMKAGAQDYLIKDRITPEALVSAILRANEKVGLIRQLKEERDRLAGSLAEKEVLIKEVHHRVKNNLQVIASLLRLQANGFGDPALANALRESQNRVESMALVHEQLYETKNLRDVDLGTHARLLAANLFHSYGDPARVSWTVAMEPIPLGVDRAIPVSLILNELISNALKHAFPGGRSGSIQVEAKREGERVALSVRDDGVGVPEEIDVHRPKSLGLEIVNILARQLKGEFELDRAGGTAFLIRFS